MYGFGPAVVVVDAAAVAIVVAAAVAAVAIVVVAVVVAAGDIVVAVVDEHPDLELPTLVAYDRLHHGVYVLRQLVVLLRADVAPLLVVAFAKQPVAAHIAFELLGLLVGVAAVPLRPLCAVPLPEPPFDVILLPSLFAALLPLSLSDVIPR